MSTFRFPHRILHYSYIAITHYYHVHVYPTETCCITDHIVTSTLLPNTLGSVRYLYTKSTLSNTGSNDTELEKRKDNTISQKMKQPIAISPSSGMWEHIRDNTICPSEYSPPQDLRIHSGTIKQEVYSALQRKRTQPV